MATKSFDEKKWQAESDAHTMAEYQAITQDKQRMNRAIKVAQQQAKDLAKRTSIMQTVAKTSTRNPGRGKK